MDQVERAAEARPVPRATSAVEIVNTTEPEASPRFEPVPEPEPVDMRSEPATRDIESQLPEPHPEPEITHLAVADLETARPAIADPEPAIAEPVQPEAEIHNAVAPEPAGETLKAADEPAQASLPIPANDTAADIAAPEPAAPEPAVSEPPPPEPLVKPILIGAGGEPPAEPRRGWWRR
jgi:hypothetical protein